MQQVSASVAQVRQLRTQLKSAKDRAGEGALVDAIAALETKAAAIEGSGRPRRGRRMPAADNAEPDFGRLSGELNALMQLVQESDMPPTATAVAASDDCAKRLMDLIARWSELKTGDVKTLNDKLREAKVPEITVDDEPAKR